MQNYTTNKGSENMQKGYDSSSEKIIEELESAPSKISDLERSCYQFDKCSCPSCVCHKSKVTLPVAPMCMAAAAPIMVIAVAG
jgi:hypothetical protein